VSSHPSSPIQSVLSESRLPLTTLREFTMLDLMNQMTDKPNWHLKVSLLGFIQPATTNLDQIFDETTTSNWKAEALAAEGRDITEGMVDWCIAELRYKAKIFEKTGAVSVYRGEVIKSDTVIPPSLKDALRRAVSLLEDVPARHKDWHPEQALDLVHPSLFPLVYGRSRILVDRLTTLADFVERCGEGETIPIPPEEEARLTRSVDPGSFNWDALRLKDPFSTKFQWLPCDVDVSRGDGNVRCVSCRIFSHSA
jgi:hypothetical protein